MLFRRRGFLLCILCAALTLVGVERNFGVDDDLTFPRQIEHHVGLQAASFLRGVGKLRMELLAFDQARFFQNRLEDHLAPIPACLGLSFQRASQVGRLARDSLVEIAESFYFGPQFGARVVFLAVSLLDLYAEFFDPLGQRTEQLLELRSVLFGEALRFVLENAVREVLDLRLQRAARFLEPRRFLFLAGQLGRELLDPREQVAPFVFDQLQLPRDLVGPRARGGQFGQRPDGLQASEQISDHASGQQHGDGPPVEFGHVI